MQYQSELSEPEAAAPSRAREASARSRELRDPFGRTLEVARDQDRTRYAVRRRRFIRRLANTSNLYKHLYEAVIGLGLGGALGGFALQIYGFLVLGWMLPDTLAIFSYAAGLGVSACFLESVARGITRAAMLWIRNLAQAEGLPLDMPPEPWHTRADRPAQNRFRQRR